MKVSQETLENKNQMCHMILAVAALSRVPRPDLAARGSQGNLRDAHPAEW
jgi:hypothetical protein